MSVRNITLPGELPGLVGPEVKRVFVVMNLVVLSQIVCTFGIGANIVNMVIFKKHGFDDTVNISLFSLAISDFGALITQQWFIICLNPWFENSDIPFSSMEIQSLTAGYPHRYFVKTAAWITAFVTFERSLCVALPLKVKSLITRKVAFAFNVGIYLFMTLTMYPLYSTTYFGWKFYPKRNRTLLGMKYTPDRKEIFERWLFLSDFCVPLIAFIVVILCTFIIAVKLKSKAKWRKTASGSATTSNEISAKDRKVVIMISVISGIFIFCFTPISAILAARSIVPDLNIIGRYANINWVCASLGMLAETVNSSVNALVYYKMSTKYRDTFRQMFNSCCKFQGKTDDLK
ncbi:uncharacterized protein LOC106013775 [Aplysia californica]|uniref:Uncharacterized protein LOC106013775 n=1 Tax=Aplysia californica TaxID=6500 RepID=A0ABM1ADY3_APLCA|nr:uncharacterized protein LOC106013775 [Aplysia californica]